MTTIPELKAKHEKELVAAVTKAVKTYYSQTQAAECLGVSARQSLEKVGIPLAGDM